MPLALFARLLPTTVRLCCSLSLAYFPFHCSVAIAGFVRWLLAAALWLPARYCIGAATNQQPTIPPLCPLAIVLEIAMLPSAIFTRN